MKEKEMRPGNGKRGGKGRDEKRQKIYFFQNLKQQKVNTISFRLFEAKVSQFVHDRS